MPGVAVSTTKRLAPAADCDAGSASTMRRQTSKSSREKGQLISELNICKRCLFECDIGKYSTHPMNKVFCLKAVFLNFAQK